MDYNKKIDLIQNSNFILGIDIAKRLHYVSLIEATGKEIRKGFSFENNKKGFDQL